MEDINWSIFIFLVSFLVHTDAGSKCFDCTRLPFPRDCDHVTQCGDHEVCYTKQIVSHSGHVFYNTGCLDRVRCINWVHRKRHVISDSLLISDDESNDIITCLQCCHGDYCNTHGCNSEPHKPYPSARGPLCFNCQKGTALPGDCETVVVCGQDEHCSIEEIVGIGGDKLYKTGCKKCGTGNFMIPVGKRSATSCSGCCQTEFCNNNCNSVTLVIPPTQTTAITPTTSYKTTQSQILPFPAPTMYSKDQQCKIVGYRYLNSYDKCFKPYSDQKLPWQQSRDKCIEDGGDLVIFHDKPEEFYIETWLLNLTSVTSRYWVGASDLGHEGTWLWVDNTTVDTELYFHPGEPNDAGNPEGFHENCAAATYFADQAHRILLNDDNCSLPSYFICEIGFTRECPDKSYLYSAAVGMCFKIYTTMWTWQQAQDKCHSEHAALVEPNTIAKIKFFDKFLRTLAIVKAKYWVGGKQSQNDPSVFTWQTTKQTIGQGLWHVGEPSSDSEHCASLHYYNRPDLDRLYLLNDLHCTDHNAFICQYSW